MLAKSLRQQTGFGEAIWTVCSKLWRWNAPFYIPRSHAPRGNAVPARCAKSLSAQRA